MMRLFLVDDEKDLREVVRELLEQSFDLTISEFSSGNEAIAAVREGLEPDCVISDYKMPNGDGSKLHEFLKSRPKMVPFILCSAYSLDSMSYFQVNRPDTLIQKPDCFKGLIRAVRVFCGDRDQGAGYAYFKADAELLRKSGWSGGPVFLKIASDNFVKVAGEGGFSWKDAEPYVAKGAKAFYLPSEPYLDFCRALAEKLAREDGERVAIPDAIHTHEVVVELTRAFGFTEATRVLIEAAVAKVRKSISASPKIEELMQSVASEDESYLSGHSVQVAHAACGLLALIEDASSKETHEKFDRLALAAFLHDLTLRDDFLARCQSAEEMLSGSKYSDVTVIEKDRYLNHPKDAAALVRLLRSPALDAGTIIEQHHELPDGSGFPNGIRGAQLGLMSSVFIVAHALIVQVHADKGRVDVERFVRENGARFKDGHFAAVMKALRELQARRG